MASGCPYAKVLHGSSGISGRSNFIITEAYKFYVRCSSKLVLLLGCFFVCAFRLFVCLFSCWLIRIPLSCFWLGVCAYVCWFVLFDTFSQITNISGHRVVFFLRFCVFWDSIVTPGVPCFHP